MDGRKEGKKNRSEGRRGGQGKEGKGKEGKGEEFSNRNKLNVMK